MSVCLSFSLINKIAIPHLLRENCWWGNQTSSARSLAQCRLLKEDAINGSTSSDLMRQGFVDALIVN